MDKRRQLWDEASNLLIQLQGIRTPMQNECKFCNNEILNFATRSFSLCSDLESLITDIQNYMEENSK